MEPGVGVGRCGGWGLEDRIGFEGARREAKLDWLPTVSQPTSRRRCWVSAPGGGLPAQWQTIQSTWKGGQ